MRFRGVKLATLGLLSAMAACESGQFSRVSETEQRPAKMIANVDGSITALDRGLQITGSSEITAVQNFLIHHADLLHLSGSDISIAHVRTTSTKFGFGLRFQQYYQGVEVVGAQLAANFDSSGNLIAINHNLRPIDQVNSNEELSEKQALDLIQQAFAREIVKVLGAEAIYISSEKGLKAGLRFDANIAQIPFEGILSLGQDGLPELTKLLPKVHGTNVKLYNGMFSPMPGRGQKAVLVVDGDLETSEALLARKLGRELNSSGLQSAQKNLAKTLSFYADQLDRSGYDNSHATVHAVADAGRLKGLDLLGLSANAFWNAEEEVFVFGAGSGGFKNFASGFDVVAHEFTHAVVSYTSDLEYAAQSGALNEHYADIMASIVESYWGEGDPMLLGETIAEKPMRNLLYPEQGSPKQPGHMSDIPLELGAGCKPEQGNDQCGVHILSGIPNRVAASVARKFGWSTLRDVVYEVMVNRLTTQSDFRNYKLNIMDQCKAMSYVELCAEFSRQFANVGL